jgi:hypothetical protein
LGFEIWTDLGVFWLDIERMVSMKGMIIRCSSIIPEIREALFRCLVCGFYSDPVVINRGNWIGYVLFIGLIVSYRFVCTNFCFLLTI